MDRSPESSSVRAADGGPSAPAARGGAIEVAVVMPSAGQGAVYAMYEARDLAADGVTLVGGLLLEKNEEVTLEIRMPDRGPQRKRARVVSHLPDASMRTAFI